MCDLSGSVPGIATNSPPDSVIFWESSLVACGVIVEHSKNNFPLMSFFRIEVNRSVTAVSSDKQDQMISALETASSRVSATMECPS